MLVHKHRNVSCHCAFKRASFLWRSINQFSIQHNKSHYVKVTSLTGVWKAQPVGRCFCVTVACLLFTLKENFTPSAQVCVTRTTLWLWDLDPHASRLEKTGFLQSTLPTTHPAHQLAWLRVQRWSFAPYWSVRRLIHRPQTKTGPLWSCCQTSKQCSGKLDPPNLCHDEGWWAAFTGVETNLWPTIHHLGSPDLPWHGCISDRGPAASGGQTVLANNRNSGRLRLIATRHDWLIDQHRPWTQDCLSKNKAYACPMLTFCAPLPHTHTERYAQTERTDRERQCQETWWFISGASHTCFSHSLDTSSIRMISNVKTLKVQ